MHGGDSLFGRVTSANYVFRDSGVDPDLDHKAYRVTEKLSESINTIGNEPSVAFYRIQEHVRKTLPQLVEQKHEVEDVQQQVQGACFDTEYAGNAVKTMQGSIVHFQNIQELLKNAMFMKQQIDYEDARKRQGRPPAPSGRQEEQQTGMKTEESVSDMADSGLSTDSSLVASSHANTESDARHGGEGPALAQGLTGSGQAQRDTNTHAQEGAVIPGEDALQWVETLSQKEPVVGNDAKPEHVEDIHPTQETQHCVDTQPEKNTELGEETQPDKDAVPREDAPPEETKPGEVTPSEKDTEPEEDPPPVKEDTNADTITENDAQLTAGT